METAAVHKTIPDVTRNPQLTVLRDEDSLAEFAAHWMLSTVAEIESPLAIALSGGSTPECLFNLLAQPEFVTRMPWSRLHWFWGDERFVPHDHPRSNFHLAWTTFLSRVPVPPANIHPVLTDSGTPAAAAKDYETRIQKFHGSDRLDPSHPLFHINLLGMGDDGHFASLFPGSTALGERTRWTVVTQHEGEARISLTYPVLENCRHAVFLISGDAKSAMLPRMLAGDPALPSGRYCPEGEFHVFADRAAAAKLNRT